MTVKVGVKTKRLRDIDEKLAQLARFTKVATNVCMSHRKIVIYTSKDHKYCLDYIWFLTFTGKPRLSFKRLFKTMKNLLFAKNKNIKIVQNFYVNLIII